MSGFFVYLRCQIGIVLTTPRHSRACPLRSQRDRHVFIPLIPAISFAAGIHTHIALKHGFRLQSGTPEWRIRVTMDSLVPVPWSLLPAPCSLFPVPWSLVPLSPVPRSLWNLSSNKHCPDLCLSYTFWGLLFLMIFPLQTSWYTIYSGYIFPYTTIYCIFHTFLINCKY